MMAAATAGAVGVFSGCSLLEKSPSNGEIPIIRVERSGTLMWVVAARKDGLF